jgi:hypothetical protein
METFRKSTNTTRAGVDISQTGSAEPDGRGMIGLRSGIGLGAK